MENFSLFYPVKPYHLNQPWGVYNPEAYAQFGFTRHNGADLALVNGQEIRIPIEAVVARIGWEPKGAGNYIVLRTLEPYSFSDGVTAFAELTFMHLLKPIGIIGQTYKTGELIALGDNTGFSTGNHTHFRLRRLNLSHY
jgi:murein DD-endopeptidase MepM/ murein hydrolase activator NlpD